MQHFTRFWNILLFAGDTRSQDLVLYVSQKKKKKKDLVLYINIIFTSLLVEVNLISTSIF